MAGKDENGVLASRGNGLVGNDITHIFDRGVVPVGGRGLGPGEIVMVLSYFKDEFADEFEHPRNMVTGVVNADEMEKLSEERNTAFRKLCANQGNAVIKQDYRRVCHDARKGTGRC